MIVPCNICGKPANPLHEFCYVHNWCDACWETDGRHTYQFNCALGVALIKPDQLRDAIAHMREKLGPGARYSYAPLDPKAPINWCV